MLKERISGGYPMQTRLTKFVVSALIALPLLATPAFSAGDGGGNSGNTCANGKVWDKKTNKCVPQQSGLMDDDSLYEAGRDLALAGRYGEAIKVLSLAEDKTDPRILNYLGYSHRKSGRVLVGLGYYEEALRNNPDIWARRICNSATVPLPARNSPRSRSAAARAARNMPSSPRRSTPM
jgi:tetratricopeptide (TPR) repeat protein